MLNRRGFLRSLAVAGLAAAARCYQAPSSLEVVPFAGIPLRDSPRVKAWLRECERRIDQVIAGSSSDDLVRLMRQAQERIPTDIEPVFYMSPEVERTLRAMAEEACRTPDRRWFKLEVRG